MKMKAMFDITTKMHKVMAFDLSSLSTFCLVVALAFECSAEAGRFPHVKSQVLANA